MASAMPPDRAKPKARRSFFKYGKCSHAELRRFLKDRTGLDFDRKTNRVKLTTRLRELARNATFTRFNDLPPELRLPVFEHLLAPDKEPRELPETQPPRPKGKIHTDVLRTSRAIYNEAEPVLCKTNSFEAVLKFAEPDHHWKLEIECHGRNLPFTDASRDGTYTWVLHDKTMTSMFRRLRRLTIKLDLGQSSGPEDTWKACRIIIRLCLFLCGDTKLEELIFSLPKDESSKVTVSMLPHMFWPLLLLRSTIAVRFEGVSDVLGSQQVGQPESSERDQRALPSGTLYSVCVLVAKIRHDCENAARINARSDTAIHATPNDYGKYAKLDPTDQDRYHIYEDLGEGRIWIGHEVRRLDPLATIVDTVDIATRSARWKRLQNLVGMLAKQDFDLRSRSRGYR